MQTRDQRLHIAHVGRALLHRIFFVEHSKQAGPDLLLFGLFRGDEGGDRDRFLLKCAESGHCIVLGSGWLPVDEGPLPRPDGFVESSPSFLVPLTLVNLSLSSRRPTLRMDFRGRVVRWQWFKLTCAVRALEDRNGGYWQPRKVHRKPPAWAISCS